MKRFYFTSIIILCLFSCERPFIKLTVSNAYDVLQTRPDSALFLIRSIDTTKIMSQRWKSRYALTKAIALDKNYIDTADASFLMPAVKYFEKYGKPKESMESYYYLGRIQYNAGDYASSIISLSKALDAGSAQRVPAGAA